MRLSTVLRTTLSASAAVVLLTACGGSDEEAAPASSTATTTAGSSAAETSEAPADADAAAFCSEAQEVFSDVEGAATTSDPAALPGILQQASDRIAQVEPPAEISESWATLSTAFAGVVANTQGLDLSTPEGQAAFTTALGSLQGEAAGAQAEVQSYFQANCDLGAAPTS